MSYQEKNSIVSMLTSSIVFIGYVTYVLNRYSLGELMSSEDTRLWALIILGMIPVSIVARIITTIILNIHYRISAGEEEPSIRDERDKLIELKGARTGHYIFILGFVVGLILLALGQPISVLFIAMIFSGFLSDLVNDLSMYFFYRRGY